MLGNRILTLLLLPWLDLLLVLLLLSAQPSPNDAITLRPIARQ